MKQSNKVPSPFFDDTGAKKFIDELFDSIRRTKSIQDLELITKTINFGTQLVKKMPDSKFPRLHLRISKEEVKNLIQKGVITENLQLSNILANGETSAGEKMSALEKLLYSLLWKNGDLGKERHLINGIVNSDHFEKFGTVFNEFGGYLSGKHFHILDQHTLRCFAVYASIDGGITVARRLELIDGTNLQHVEWIKSYKSYYEEITTNLLCKKSDYLYFVDRLLFGAGKLIKLNRSNNL